MNIPLDKFEEWLINKNLKERTIENYVYYFNKFTFDVFNQETVSRFLANKSNRNSIGRSFLVNFQKFLKVNYNELGISHESWKNIVEVELPKLTGRTKERLPRWIPHGHIRLLEQALKTEQLKIQLLLSYYCALRLGELLKITILSFDWDMWGKDTSKRGECRVFGKGDKEGIALVPAVIMKRVATYIKGKGFNSLDSKLFVRGNADINMKNKGRTWQMKLRQAGIDAGITKIDGEGKVIKKTVVNPHILRHSYATYLKNVKGMDIRDIQEVLRHASIQSTQIYTHTDKEGLKKKLDSYD